MFVDLPREGIRLSPEYTEESQLTRDYETGLHRHYNHQGYWVDEEQLSKGHSRLSKHEKGLFMMNHTYGGMSGWAGGGMWIWAVIGVLVVVLLVVLIF